MPQEPETVIVTGSSGLIGAALCTALITDVENDVWAAGETVSVDSSIGNNAMLAGGTIYLQAGSVVGHDARLAGNLVKTESR